MQAVSESGSKQEQGVLVTPQKGIAEQAAAVAEEAAEVNTINSSEW